MKLAYLGEAEVSEALGLDFKENVPFSVGIELNRSHPFVEKVLKKNKKKSQKTC